MKNTPVVYPVYAAAPEEMITAIQGLAEIANGQHLYSFADDRDAIYFVLSKVPLLRSTIEIIVGEYQEENE